MINISLKNIFVWMLHFIKFMGFSSRRRFLAISPPFIKTQIIYDKKNGDLFKIKIRNVIDWCTVTQIFYDNDYGFERLVRGQEIEDYYRKILDSGETPLIIDCGANIGLATRFFSKTYPKSNVLCVEPVGENIEQARINNAGENINYFEAAVGEIDMRGKIIDPGLGNWGFRIESDLDGGVEILSINTLIKMGGEKLKPFIVKIDIEGFEDRLFSSNVEWIDEFPVLIIELHDGMLPNTANSSNFLKQISRLNRDFLFYGENVFSLSNKIKNNGFINVS